MVVDATQQNRVTAVGWKTCPVFRCFDYHDVALLCRAPLQLCHRGSTELRCVYSARGSYLACERDAEGTVACADVGHGHSVLQLEGRRDAVHLFSRLIRTRGRERHVERSRNATTIRYLHDECSL